MAMGRQEQAMLLTLNLLALAVLWPHVADTQVGQRIGKHFAGIRDNIYTSLGLPTPKEPPCGLAPFEEFAITSNRVVLPDGIQPATVHINGGKIVNVTLGLAVESPLVINFKDAVISPGVIDVHVHLNEPGRTEWEGITTGTSAAAAGGITTLIDMPLNSDPCTTIASRLQEKQEIANVKALVTVGHWAGLTPENAADHTVLQELVDAGAMGFKSFMSPSGINDFPNVGAADIAAALPFLKAAGVPFFVHAEFVSEVPEHEAAPTKYIRYLSSRPPKFEQDAIELLIRLLDEDKTAAAPGFRLHIAHLADAGSLAMIKAARERGLPITVETCAHYLSFSAEEIGDGYTLFKCAPPIRDEENRKALLAAVIRGDIDLVSSDHSPAPPDLKEIESGDFLKAWGGISGLQYLLPATWSAIKAGGGDLETLTRVLSTEPAKLIGAESTKGKIQAGYDADLVVWEPDAVADTSKKGNMHQHKLSPYNGMELLGQVQATFVRGAMMNYLGNTAVKPCGAAVATRAARQQQQATA